MNEEMIISLAKEGHEHAFRQLYEINRERIFRLACRYTRSQLDAEDIMQETFIKAFKNIHSFTFKNNSSFATWLNRICINCSINHIRKWKRRKMDQMDLFSHILVVPESSEASPEDALQSGQVLILLKQAIKKLTLKQQIIFDLRHSQHLQIKEIAETMNCSESSVKTHLFRTISKLRKNLTWLLEEQ